MLWGENDRFGQRRLAVAGALCYDRVAHVRFNTVDAILTRHSLSIVIQRHFRRSQLL